MLDGAVSVVISAVRLVGVEELRMVEVTEVEMKMCSNPVSK